MNAVYRDCEEEENNDFVLKNGDDLYVPSGALMAVRLHYRKMKLHKLYLWSMQHIWFYSLG